MTCHCVLLKLNFLFFYSLIFSVHTIAVDVLLVNSVGMHVELYAYGFSQHTLFKYGFAA